jgi:hypothetical protein
MTCKNLLKRTNHQQIIPENQGKKFLVLEQDKNSIYPRKLGNKKFPVTEQGKKTGN